MAYYTFYQNNSGGSFVLDKKNGLTHFVIIEADTADEANTKAEDLGIYFYGWDKGWDCPCCGDRWYAVGHYDDNTLHPEIYGQKVGEHNLLGGGWMDDGYEIAVHHKDGTIQWYGHVGDDFPGEKDGD